MHNNIIQDIFYIPQDNIMRTQYSEDIRQYNAYTKWVQAHDNILRTQDIEYEENMMRTQDNNFIRKII